MEILLCYGYQEDTHGNVANSDGNFTDVKTAAKNSAVQCFMLFDPEAQVSIVQEEIPTTVKYQMVWSPGKPWHPQVFNLSLPPGTEATALLQGGLFYFIFGLWLFPGKNRSFVNFHRKSLIYY